MDKSPVAIPQWWSGFAAGRLPQPYRSWKPGRLRRRHRHRRRRRQLLRNPRAHRARLSTGALRRRNPAPLHGPCCRPGWSRSASATKSPWPSDDGGRDTVHTVGHGSTNRAVHHGLRVLFVVLVVQFRGRSCRRRHRLCSAAPKFDAPTGADQPGEDLGRFFENALMQSHERPSA